MSLTETLKEEHAAMKALLDDVKSAGINTLGGQKNLARCKHLLVAHLKKEDVQLYPALKKLEAANEIASSFQDEMTSIEKSALAFFEKYKNGSEHSMEFAKEFGALMGSLGARIRKEEVVLYPKYDQYVG